MNLENKKIVLFDFDGVLIDTLGILFFINQEINQDLSIEEYKSFFKGNIYDATRKDGTFKKNHPDFDSLYKLKTREMMVPDPLKFIIKELSNLYTLIIVSSTHSELIKNILEREKISEYFTEILGADVDRNKVIKINSVLTKYSVLSKDVVFITDTVGDIKEAEKCGVRSIAVTWGFHDKETLEKANPAIIIDNPGNLIKNVQDLLK